MDMNLKRLRLLAWIWRSVHHDPFERMGAAPTESAIRQWLGRIGGVVPKVRVEREDEVALAVVAPIVAHTPLFLRLKGEIPKARTLLAAFALHDR